MNEMENLTNTLDDILAYEKAFKERRVRMEANKCRECTKVIEAGAVFCSDECKNAWWGIDRMQIEREKNEVQREDAGEARRELAREAIELMVREPMEEERFDRNTEPQDNILSEAVKSDR